MPKVVNKSDEIKKRIEELWKKRFPQPEALSPAALDVETRLAAGQEAVLTSDIGHELYEDFTMPEDWMMKVTPGKNGDVPKYTFRSPEGLELTDEDIMVTPEGMWLTPKGMDILDGMPQAGYAEAAYWEKQGTSIVAKDIAEYKSGEYVRWDYKQNQFVPTTKKGFETRESFYAGMPEIAPQGTPGKYTPQDYAEFKRVELDYILGEVFPERYEGLADAEKTKASQKFIQDFIKNAPVEEASFDPETQSFVNRTAQEQFFIEMKAQGRTRFNEKLLEILMPDITPEDIDSFFYRADRPENTVIQKSVSERMGYTPTPQAKTAEERNARAKAFRAYRKAGGKLYADQWELYGMPSTPEDEPPKISDEERNKVIQGEIQKQTNLLEIFGKGLTKLPKQLAASVLSAVQGKGGASVVDKDWKDIFIEDAQTDLRLFAQETLEKYGEGDLPIKPSDIAYLPQNIAYSLTSMGAGIVVGVPIGMAPVPGARAAAWVAGSAASGVVAYNMTTYQIMQEYLEIKNQEKGQETGEELTREEEAELKADFDSKAREYGLWEAVPEAISNLLFAKILTTPLTRVVGRNIAIKILSKFVSIYGEELLTETITQKGQSAIEVKAGLREGNITWVEAFKEVAPQTFLLTTVLGGVGATGVSTINRIKASLKTEITETNPLFKDIEKGLDDSGGSLEGIIEGVEDVIPEIPAEIVTPEVTPKVTPVEEAPVTPSVKEPWQMTKGDYIKEGKSRTSLSPEQDHRGQVFAALREGKPVPAEVLADYPDLKAPAAPEVTEIIGTGKWNIVKFGEYKITERDKIFYNKLSKYAQENIEGMNRKYQVNLSTFGAVSDVKGAKVTPFTEDSANKYLSVGLFGEGGRGELQSLAKIYGAKQVADAQELFHEIGHSVGIVEETATNKFSVEHTKKFLETQPQPPATPEVTKLDVTEPYIKARIEAIDNVIKGDISTKAEAKAILGNRGLYANDISRAVYMAYSVEDPSGIGGIAKTDVLNNLKQSLLNEQRFWEERAVKPAAVEAKTTAIPITTEVTPPVTKMTKGEYREFIDTPQGKAEWDKIRLWNNEQSKLGRADKVGQKAVDVYYDEVIQAEVTPVAPQAVSEGVKPPEGVIPPVEPIAEEVELLRQLGELQKMSDIWRAKLQSRDQTKIALAKYVRENLPMNVRGKYVTAVARVGTDAQLQKQIDRVNAFAETNAQKVLKVTIKNELKKAKTVIKDHVRRGKFTPQTQGYLDTIILNLNKSRDAARDKMVANNQAYEDGKLSFEDMQKDNEALNFAGIDGMSSQELANTLEYIKILETIGRTERQAKQEANNERFKAIRADISYSITGGKGLKTGIGAVPREELAAKPGWLDNILNWHYGLDSLMDKISKLDPRTQVSTFKPYSSVTNQFVAPIHRATARQIIGKKEAYNNFKKVVKEVYNVKSNHDLNQVLNGFEEKVNLGTFELTEEYKENNPDRKADTFTLNLKRKEIIASYMQMKDPTTDGAFKIGMGWSQEVRDIINNSITEQEKKMADAVFKFYDDYYPTLNPIYQELNNIDMPRNPFYSPRFRDFLGAEGNVSETILSFREAQIYAGVTAQSIKARQQSNRPIKITGFTDLLFNHIDQMEHWKAFALVLRDMRRVFSSPEVKMAIEQYHGRGINEKIDTLLNQLARDGVETAATNKAADYVRRAFTKSVLAKPILMPKQLPSIFAYISEMNVGDFFVGVENFWESPIDNAKFLYNNSESFKARVSEGYEQDIRLALAKHGKGRLTGKMGFTNYFLLHIRLGDAIAVSQGMWSKMTAELKGMGVTKDTATPEQLKTAIEAAEDTTNRTQPSFGIDTLSAIQNGGSWHKLMMMFLNQPAQYFRIEATALRNLRYGRGSRAKAASTLVLVHCILPMMFQLITDAFQWKPERQLRAAVLGAGLNSIFIAGQITQSIWGWLSGDPFDYQVSPVLSTVDEFQKACFRIGKLIDQGQDISKDINMEDVAALIEYLAKAGGQLTGLPTPYLVQVEKALRTKEEGDPIGAKDFIFSQWALEPPKKNAEEKVEDLNLKLGVEKEGAPEKTARGKLTPVSDTGDWFKGIGEIYKKNLPQDILDDPEKSKESKAWARYAISKSKSDILPDVPLYKINTDDDEYTIINYRDQWAARGKITSLEKLAEYDNNLYPYAYLGNVDRTTYSLLVKYLDAEDKETFLKEHKDLLVNPRREWLIANPKDNAIQALDGDTSILTLEAYNEFKGLLKELDIPEDAIPVMTFPSDFNAEDHFTREALVAEGRENSAKGQLLLLENSLKAKEAGVESYAEWHNDLKVSDKEVGYLKLKADNQVLYDKMDAIKDNDALDDDAKEEARAETRATKVGKEIFGDVERRVDAMGKGTRDNPIKPMIVDAYVAHMRIVDEFSAGSAEAKLNRYDDTELNAYLMNEDYHGKQKASPLHEDKEYLDNNLVPRWRIDVEYKTEDSEYQDILDKYEGSEETAEAKAYLADHKDYRLDRRRREAYGLSNSRTGYRFPVSEVENYVTFSELGVKGQRQNRMLITNPVFADALHNANGHSIPLAKDVPAVQFDDIYDKYKEKFGRIDGLGNSESDYWVKDNMTVNPETGRTPRQEVAYSLRFTDGKLNDFGKAEVRREGYKYFVPEEYIARYTEWRTIEKEGIPDDYPDDLSWYEDDWYLIEHPTFYRNIYLGAYPKKHEEFDEKGKPLLADVPTREIFAKYKNYLKKLPGKERYDYRAVNLDLEKWLLAKKYVTEPIWDKKMRAEMTAVELGQAAIRDIPKGRLN